MSLCDCARQYQIEQQTLAEIKAVLEADITPLAMLAAIAAIMHPRLAANPAVIRFGLTDFHLPSQETRIAPDDSHGPTTFEFR